MMSGFYMFLSSVDGIKQFTDNAFDNFVVEFTPEIRLDCNTFHSQWTFALTEIRIANSTESLLPPEPCIVLCDLAQSSYINDTQAPVLRTFASESEQIGSLYQSYYVGLTSYNFNRISISIKNSELKPLQSSLWGSKATVKIVLHFQRI